MCINRIIFKKESLMEAKGLSVPKYISAILRESIKNNKEKAGRILVNGQ